MTIIVQDDPWIDSHTLLSPVKMHAIGYITLAWNWSEYHAASIFTNVLGVPDTIGRAITHDLGDRTIWNKIIVVGKVRGLPSEIVSELEFASKSYERCNANRNLFIHALTSMRSAGDGSLKLVRKKGPATESFPIDDTLEDVRRVADEILLLLSYLQSLSRSVSNHNSGKHLDLPERPVLPEYVWKQPSHR